MYSERDMNEINRRLRLDVLVAGPIVLALLAAYVAALAVRIQWLAMVSGALLFIAACYAMIAHILPHLRYRGFLLDIQRGLSREVRGTVVAVAETPEAHDGAFVLPVRVKLDAGSAAQKAVPTSSVESKRLNLEARDDTEDERIVYLNVSKREGFPRPGAAVALRCFGRHIREVTVL